MKIHLYILLAFALLVSCQNKNNSPTVNADSKESVAELGLEEAQKIIALPLHCLELEYPNKLGQVLGSKEELKTPQELRPIFYGCFDWHSSVHGFWTIVSLLHQFPELDEDYHIREQLNRMITPENVAVELAFFNDPNNRNFERTYGWAWFFQLHGTLLKWKDKDAQRWADALQPMADLFTERYSKYLPKLLYPIRTGTHDNTAFGLSMTLDYARLTGNTDFENLIRTHAIRLYENDARCALEFEPSGHDFLSPCLEEARLMSKLYDFETYERWLKAFLPQLFASDFQLEVARVSDRSDGHLVHLDGLNFSRATCLTAIAVKIPELQSLQKLAELHFQTAFPNISDDDYMGSHWLGSFALYYLLEVK